MSLTTTITLTNRGDTGRFNSKRMLVILPNNQKAFIPVYYLDNTIEIAYCDPGITYCNIHSNYLLTNAQIDDFDFINYSLKYTCIDPMNCSGVTPKLAELDLCYVFFVKNQTKDYDSIWQLTSKKGCGK